jgi:DNA-binding MarR family transcriptional regulator
MEQDFEKRLKAVGITRSSYAVLSAIHHVQKSTPAAVTQFLGINGAAVTRHLDRLEQGGLIQRAPSAKDRRSIELRLTEQGTAMVGQGRAFSEETNRRFTDGLSAAQLKELRSCIQLMLTHGDRAITDI